MKKNNSNNSKLNFEDLKGTWKTFLPSFLWTQFRFIGNTLHIANSDSIIDFIELDTVIFDNTLKDSNSDRIFII